MPSTKDYLIGIYEKAKEAISLLSSILTQLGGAIPTKPIIANFPQSGKREISANGILTINTRKGEAVLPDGSTENLSSPIPDDLCRSILLDTNAQINLELFEAEKTSISSTIYPSKIRLHSIPFDRIKIKTSSAAATIQLFISNVEAPTIEDISPDICLDVIPKPKGDTQAIGTGVATNTSTYVEILSHTITTGKTFHLAKIEVPCKNSHYLQLKIGDTTYPPAIVPDDTTHIDWFPWDDGLLGDGTKKIIIEAKAVATGETLYATIWGQED